MSNFARILNAKPLLLTPDKRVMHFPATNKVRIDNILPDNPEYRNAAQRSNRKEYANASKAALETGLVPPVQNYRERGNMTSYTQDYAGKPLPDKLEGMSPKEQYKIGSQIGRMQNRLYEKGMGHMDIHEGNVVRPNPNKKQLKLVDNASVRPIEDEYDTGEMKNPYSRHWLGKPFMTGYNSRINFTQHKQMQHFADFGLEQLVGQASKLSDKAYQYAKVNPTKVLAGAGAIGGALQGTGLGESEEERANTSGLGRAGKIFGNAALGGTIGAGVGTVAKKADQLGAQAAQKYKRGATPDPYSNPARQSGQMPRSIEIDDDIPPTFQRENNRIWSTPKKPTDNGNDWSNVPNGWANPPDPFANPARQHTYSPSVVYTQLPVDLQDRTRNYATKQTTKRRNNFADERGLGA